MTAVTVVVPTRDRPGHLARCLAAVGPQLREADEVLVVDSASTVPVRADVPVLRLARPGTSLARNSGWQAARTPVVAFLDDDVAVAPGWRAALDDALDGVEGVCGRVTVPPDQADAERPVAVTPDLPEQLLRPGQGVGVAANFAVRVAALRAAGGFDERLGPGTWFAAAEDQELIDRLLLSGARVRYTPDLLAHHDQWRGRGALLRLDWGYGKGAGARVVATRRSHPALARVLARSALWENGLAPLGDDLRRGYQFGVATALVRTAGVLAGLAGALVRSDRP